MSLSGNSLVEICALFIGLSALLSLVSDEESLIALHRTPLLVIWGRIRLIGFPLISEFVYAVVASSI